MATWKKVIVSGSNAILNQVTASGGFSGDGSGITGISGISDNNFTTTLKNKLDAIEASADVTDATNVTAAGALMDSELTNLAAVKAINQSLVSGATPTFTATNFTDASDKRFMSNAQETKLDSVESSADVTDTTNVTAAGALMDSELTNLAAVKAINQGLTTTGTPTFSTLVITNGTTFGESTATDKHAFIGHITASGAISASGEIIANRFIGNGAGLTSLPSQTDNNFTTTLKNKLDAIEASADVTDATNVTAAGALMDSELTNLAAVKAINQSLVSGATPTFTATNFTDASDKRFMSNAQETKLDSVESSADVTDTANVTSAGALMDSELTSIADVKALDQSVVSGATPTFTTTNFTDASNKRLMTDAQETKLDSVESSADVTDTANVTAAGALMDSELTNLAAVKAIDQSLVTTANPQFNNLTIAGDLTVSGDTVTVNAANLNIEDPFILLKSGSANTSDSGIIFGGSSGTSGQGKAIVWDASYNSNDGRLAVSTTAVTHNNTTNFDGSGTAGYYVAGVFAGSEADAATAKADHNGNIRIESNEIYIYA
jgi:hypothetical protein